MNTQTKDKCYRLVGEMVATMLFQEGESPSILAPSIVNYTRTSSCQVFAKDVPGYLGQMLVKVWDVDANKP